MKMRLASKQEWNCDNTVAHINCGSFQRIADATELMAKSHRELIEERDRYKRWYDEEAKRVKKLRGTIAALKAWATRRRIYGGDGNPKL